MSHRRNLSLLGGGGPDANSRGRGERRREREGETNCQKWTFELPDLEQRCRSKGQIAESIRTGNITQIATMIWYKITIATGDLFSFQGAQNKVEIRHCFLMLLERIPVEKKR